MPRKSLEEHALAGTRPHYETSKVLESHIAAGRPKCPRYLSLEAKRKFRALVRDLEARRTLTPGDASLLILAATLWGRWREAQQHLDTEGAVVTVTCYSKNGDEYQRDKRNPWLDVAMNAEKQLSAILTNLGLTVNHRDRAKPARDIPKDHGSNALQSGADVLAFIQKRDG